MIASIRRRLSISGLSKRQDCRHLSIEKNDLPCDWKKPKPVMRCAQSVVALA